MCWLLGIAVLGWWKNSTNCPITVVFAFGGEISAVSLKSMLENPEPREPAQGGDFDAKVQAL